MSKTLLRFVIVLAAATCSAGIAAAQDVPTTPPPFPPQGGGVQNMRMQMPDFGEMDKNKDKKISKDEFPGPAQFFDRLDENRDGFIDEEEWNRMRSRMGGGSGGGGGGGPMRVTESLNKYLDANADGKVSREEFGKLLHLFDILDKDHDGQVSQEELGRFFPAIGELQAEATGGVDVAGFFANNDKNKDGKITADEFTNEKLFKALDLNKDGSITREEAAQSMKQMADASKKKQQQPQPKE